MSFTAALWALLYAAAVLGSFFQPILGAFGYLLEYYMRPSLKWWGDELPTLRYNLIISVVFVVTFLLRRESLPRVVSIANPATRWLALLAVIMAVVTATVAVHAPTSADWAIQWAKMAIVFPLLLAGVVRSKATFNLVIAAHMLGAFWWGYEAWDDPRRVAGRLVNIGSGDSLHDNAAAAHLLTVLPFAVLYAFTETRLWLRAIAIVALPFVINTLILCNSRGSMVGLAAGLAASVLLVRTGFRLRIVGTGFGVLLLVLLMADTQFITRQQSTTNYEEDSSASQRLTTWKAAYELVKDRPLGAGGRGFHLLSPIYIPDIVEAHGGDLRAPHNTYAMVASEWGIAGLVSFIGIYASAMLMTRRVKRATVTDAPRFYYWRALAIQLSLVSYLVASSFSDRLYGEAGYWMVALAYALYRIQATELSAAAGVDASESASRSQSRMTVAKIAGAA